MTQFILYGTSACHLCEQAKSVLQQCRIEFECFDILEDEAISERLAWLIPVLHHSPTGAELNWPFDLKSVQNFYINCNNNIKTSLTIHRTN